MDEPAFNIEQANIAIIGLGLMGGSLALSLKDKCRRLSALDTDVETLDFARRTGVVQKVGSDPEEILADADLVILACPVPEIINWLKRLPQYIQRDCIVMDIGSTKRAITEAMDSLPGNFDPIGGHAVCGKEKLSLKNAEVGLFRDAPFILTPLVRTSPRTRQAAVEILAALQSTPLWIDADRHDRLLASTSHLPFLLSVALVLATPEEAAEMIGPGFRSTSRLAATPSSMMLGVLQTNRDNVMDFIDDFQEQLSFIKNSLRDNNSEELKSTLDAAQLQYQAFIQ